MLPLPTTPPTSPQLGRQSRRDQQLQAKRQGASPRGLGGSLVSRAELRGTAN